MIIHLGKGIESIRFGMTVKDIISLCNDPKLIEELNIKEEKYIDFIYNDYRLSFINDQLFFIEIPYVAGKIYINDDCLSKRLSRVIEVHKLNMIDDGKAIIKSENKEIMFLIDAKNHITRIFLSKKQ